MGPKACSVLFDFIVEHTSAANDQQHPSVVIINDSKIPDRSSYIFDNNLKNPIPFLKSDLQKLNEIGTKVVGIACNTSHLFAEDISYCKSENFIHMPNAALKYCLLSGYKQVIVLATKGTIKTRIFENQIYPFKIEYPSDEDTELIHSLIYKIKNTKTVNLIKQSKVLKKLLLKISSQVNTKDTAIILGCTELSILNKYSKYSLDFPIIDPLEILGLLLIHKSGYKIAYKNCGYHKEIIENI